MTTWITANIGFVLLILAVLLIIAGIVYGMGWLFRRANKQDPGRAIDTLPLLYIGAAIVLMLIFLIGASFFPNQDALQIALLVVVAIIAMVTLLFIIAAGFAHLSLSNPSQALGLPEGSIRAMIALILIMVFIIFGVYLLQVSGGPEYGPIQIPTAEVLQHPNISRTEAIADSENSRVWLKNAASTDSLRLAQQLLTTIGTLVVAVAGFYFGSSVVSSAAAAVRGGGGAIGARPSIAGVTPGEGKVNEVVQLTISGSDFQIPRNVRLARGAEEISGTAVMVSGARDVISANVRLDKPANGDAWDVVVQNDDGSEARLPKAFKIVGGEEPRPQPIPTPIPTPTPTPTPTPETGRPGTPVTIIGVGFGAEKGTVSFGDVAADIVKWSDREVVATVPAAAKSGKVPVILIPKGTDRKLISRTEFQIVSGDGSGAADNEGDIDGCDVAVTGATPDEDLPAAEGGVQR